MLAFPVPQNDLSAFSDTLGHILLMDAQNRDKAQMLTDTIQNYSSLMLRC